MDEITPSDFIGWENNKGILEAHYSAAYGVLKKYFGGEGDFNVFVSKIPEKERAYFFDAITFYYHCQQVGDKTPQLRAIQLIMIFSAIERLMAKGEEFQDFYHWMISKKNKDEIKQYLPLEEKNYRKGLKEVYNQYKDEFGSIRKVNSFFKQFVTVEDQRKLIQGLEFIDPKTIRKGFPGYLFTLCYQTDCGEVTAGLKQLKLLKNHEKVVSVEMDKYYNWTAKTENGKTFQMTREQNDGVCIQSGRTQDKTLEALESPPHNSDYLRVFDLDKGVKEMVEIMYTMRNQFVHQALLPQSNFIKNQDKTAMGVWYGGTPKKYKGYGFRIIIPFAEIKGIFERGVLRSYGVTEEEIRIVEGS